MAEPVTALARIADRLQLTVDPAGTVAVGRCRGFPIQIRVVQQPRTVDVRVSGLPSMVRLRYGAFDRERWVSDPLIPAMGLPSDAAALSYLTPPIRALAERAMLRTAGFHVERGRMELLYHPNSLKALIRGLDQALELAVALMRRDELADEKRVLDACEQESAAIVRLQLIRGLLQWQLSETGARKVESLLSDPDPRCRGLVSRRLERSDVMLALVREARADLGTRVTALSDLCELQAPERDAALNYAVHIDGLAVSAAKLIGRHRLSTLVGLLPPVLERVAPASLRPVSLRTRSAHHVLAAMISLPHPRLEASIADALHVRELRSAAIGALRVCGRGHALKALEALAADRDTPAATVAAARAAMRDIRTRAQGRVGIADAAGGELAIDPGDGHGRLGVTGPADPS